MKKMIYLVVIMLMLINIQQTIGQKRVGDPKDYLTQEQLNKYYSDIEKAELEKKLKVYGDWVGVGGEVGIAIKDGLSAVVEVSDKFSKTDVGKFTMLMIAWKIMGKDIVQILLGLLFLLIFTWVLIYSFKRTCIDRKVLISNPGLFRYPKEYKIIKPLYSETGGGIWAVRIAHLSFFMLNIWISYSIMF